ncbi:MAG: hypothetical protein LBH71_00815 [Oscillospiraceae bacterium]|nr:hypothetical protein [Oscillospiraceae bacterium]
MKNTKKFITLALVLFIALQLLPVFSFAAGTDLIKNVGISLKSTENPKRLEVQFDLAESINLSKGDSNIIFEYLMFSNDGKLKSMNYTKNRSWSGYLNSYDNYPSGERKYSSGGTDQSYSDIVPSATIYTSVKTGSSIDVTLVDAVRITVLRANGSGEKLVIYSNGTVGNIEKIDLPIEKIDKDTGIKLEATTDELPEDTVLNATRLTSGTIYEIIKDALAGLKDFVVFEITLESDGVKIKPDGKVEISIPIPERFNSNNLEVYRVDSDGTKTQYPVTVTTEDGIHYATFETNHFSVYVLESGVGTPKTGDSQAIYYLTLTAIMCTASMIVVARFKKARSIY